MRGRSLSVSIIAIWPNTGYRGEPFGAIRWPRRPAAGLRARLIGECRAVYACVLRKWDGGAPGKFKRVAVYGTGPYGRPTHKHLDAQIPRPTTIPATGGIKPNYETRVSNPVLAPR